MTNAIAESIMNICDQLPVKSILVATASGTTARAIASYRPRQKIYAFTATALAARQLNLTYGVEAIQFTRSAQGRDIAIATILQRAKKEKYIKRDDIVLIVSGANIMHQGATNMLEIVEVK